MERIYKILPKYAFIPIISCLLLNSITYFGSRIFTTGMHHYDISIAIDRMLPFVTPMVSVYVLAYVTWILGFIIIGRESKKLCYEVCSAEMIAKLICLVCFQKFLHLCKKRYYKNFKRRYLTVSDTALFSYSRVKYKRVI